MKITMPEKANAKMVRCSIKGSAYTRLKQLSEEYNIPIETLCSAIIAKAMFEDELLDEESEFKFL